MLRSTTMAQRRQFVRRNHTSRVELATTRDDAHARHETCGRFPTPLSAVERAQLRAAKVGAFTVADRWGAAGIVAATNRIGALRL